jgi:NitT/TauT family transport system substrate-binding protein
MNGLFCRKVIAPIGLLFVVVTHSPAHAQTAEKLRVAYSVIAPTQATVWTAKELGMFAKNGLDVDLVLLVGAPLAVTALVSGETPIVYAGASAVVTSNLQGSGTVLVAGGANRFPYVLFVTDEIKRVEDLRGKKFGVSRIGSADNAAAITVFNKLGIKDTEITYVQAGSIPARLAAMQTNALQATLLQAPETLKAKEIGMRPLLDFTKTGHGAPFYQGLRRGQRLQFEQSQRRAEDLAEISCDQRR